MPTSCDLSLLFVQGSEGQLWTDIGLELSFSIYCDA